MGTGRHHATAAGADNGHLRKIADGTITATDVAGSTFAAFGTVTRPVTANRASVETDSSPFGAFLNCTISRSTAHSVHGSRVLKAVATADGQFIAGLDVESFPVVPGETITATFALKADRNTGRPRHYQWATGGSPGDLVLPDSHRHDIVGQHSDGGCASGVRRNRWAVLVVGRRQGLKYTWTVSGVEGCGWRWAMPGTPIPGGSHTPSTARPPDRLRRPRRGRPPPRFDVANRLHHRREGAGFGG